MGDARDIEHSAAAWLARRDGPHWSTRDEEALGMWLNDALPNRVAFVRLEAAWNQSGRLKVLSAGIPAGTIPARGSLLWSPFSDAHAVSAAPRAPRASAARRGRPVRTRHVRSGALALVLSMFVLPMLLFWWHSTQDIERATYENGANAPRVVELADGSVATLNSNSRMRVAVSRDERAIELELGEVFFEVVKDSARPFVVRAGGRRVVAVGTRFAVRRDDGGLRVIVTQGTVRLESNTAADGARQSTVLLPAGSIATISDAALQVHQLPIDRVEDMLSWRDGYLSFEATTLAEAVAEFNRYNRHRILIADASVARMTVDGSFRLSNPDAFVRLLQQGFPIDSEQNGDTFVLRHR